MPPINDEEHMLGYGKKLLELFTPPSSSASEVDKPIASIAGLLYNMERLDTEQRSKLLILFGSGYAIDMERDSIERDNFKKLVELLDDPQTLMNWLNLFNSSSLLKSFLRSYKTPQLLQASLDTFTPSAITYLMEKVGFEGLSNVVNKSAESSAMNELFAADNLHFSHLKGNGEAHREYGLFKIALNGLGSFQTEAPFHVKHRMLHMHASLEGDVATSCVINVLLPVASVMNEVLANSYKERKTPPKKRQFVGIRAEVQLSLDGLTSRVDHALVLNNPGPDESYTQPFKSGVGKILVLFEEKIIGSMKADWTTINMWKNNKAMLIERHELGEVYKMMPQIRKYVFASQVPYIMEADGDTFVSMIWDGCSTWKERKNTGVVGNYGKESHEKLRTHACKFAMCIESERAGVPSDADLAKRGLDQIEVAPRLGLAFLCWLALRDEGLL